MFNVIMLVALSGNYFTLCGEGYRYIIHLCTWYVHAIPVRFPSMYSSFDVTESHSYKIIPAITF